MEPKIGQFAVVDGSWRPACVEISAVTSKTVSVIEKHSGRGRRTNRDNLLFVGSRQSAERLCEELVSSRAQWEKERYDATHRRIERDKKLIDAAIAEAASFDAAERT